MLAEQLYLWSPSNQRCLTAGGYCSCFMTTASHSEMYTMACFTVNRSDYSTSATFASFCSLFSTRSPCLIACWYCWFFRSSLCCSAACASPEAGHTTRLLVLRHHSATTAWHKDLCQSYTPRFQCLPWQSPAGLHDAGNLVDLGGQAAGSNETCQFLIHKVWPDAKCCRHGAQLHAFVRLQELRHAVTAASNQLSRPAEYSHEHRSTCLPRWIMIRW